MQQLTGGAAIDANGEPREGASQKSGRRQQVVLEDSAPLTFRGDTTGPGGAQTMPEDLEAKVRPIVALPPPRAGSGAVRGREVHAQIHALDRIAPILPIRSRAAGVADPGLRPARHRDPVRRVGGSDREGHRRLLRSAPPPGAPGLPQAGREDLSSVTRARPHALARWRRRSSTVQRRPLPHPTRDSRHQPQRSRRPARGLPLGAVDGWPGATTIG